MTTASDGRAWAHFSAWCRARGLRPLPAHPWTVAAYLRWCEPRLGTARIGHRLKAIARRHFLNKLKSPVRHPTVSRTLRLIERRTRTRGERAALFKPEDFLTLEPNLYEKTWGGKDPEPGDMPGDIKARRTFRTTPRLKPRRPNSKPT